MEPLPPHVMSPFRSPMLAPALYLQYRCLATSFFSRSGTKSRPDPLTREASVSDVRARGAPGRTGEVAASAMATGLPSPPARAQMACIAPKGEHPMKSQSHRSCLGRLFAASLAAAGALAICVTQLPAGSLMTAYNKPGNILIADQFNNRVIETDPAGNIVWRFGLGPNDVSARSAIGTNDAQRVEDATLIAGTGAPPGTEPLCPNGCADNRVMLVDEDGSIIWQYGRFGVTGSKHNQINTPVQAT